MADRPGISDEGQVDGWDAPIIDVPAPEVETPQEKLDELKGAARNMVRIGKWSQAKADRVIAKKAEELKAKKRAALIPPIPQTPSNPPNPNPAHPANPQPERTLPPSPNPQPDTTSFTAAPIVCSDSGSVEPCKETESAYMGYMGRSSSSKGGGQLNVNELSDTSCGTYLVHGDGAITGEQYRLVKDLPVYTLQLLEHLVHSTQTPGDAVPVSWDAMHAHLTDCPWKTKRVWEPLKQRGWVEVDSYSIIERQSREYTLTLDFWTTFLPTAPKRPTRRYDGRRFRKRQFAYDTRLTDKAGNRYTGLVAAALRHFEAGQEVTVDWAAMKELQRRRRDQLSDDSPERDWQRYLGDAQRMQEILSQMIEETPTHLTYRPAYEVQIKSGRLTELGGCMQGMTREMKEAAYASQKDLFNYDLVGSHQSIAAAFCHHAGIDASPILSFDRATLMASTGMKKGDAKPILYGTFNGAAVPSSAAQAETYKKEVTVHRLLKKAAAYTGQPLEALYEATAPLLLPIKETIRKAAARYVGDFFDAHANTGRGGRCLRNASGIALYLRDADVDTHKGRATALCHLLQGTEAAVGHALIQIQDEYGYRVVAHEHDGVITQGRIPQEAIQHALQIVSEAAHFDVTGLDLVLKPYDKEMPDHFTAYHTMPAPSFVTTTTAPSWTRSGSRRPRSKAPTGSPKSTAPGPKSPSATQAKAGVSQTSDATVAKKTRSIYSSRCQTKF